MNDGKGESCANVPLSVAYFHRISIKQPFLPLRTRKTQSQPEAIIVRSNSGLQLGIPICITFLAGAQFYEIALHSSFLLRYCCVYLFNHIHWLRVAGNWQPGVWFTNPDVFCKQHRHQQRAKRDAHVADHERLIGNNYC